LSKPSVRSSLPKPVFYYDTGRKIYWGQAASCAYIPLTEKALVRHLGLAGFSKSEPRDGSPSPVDREIARIQLDQSIVSVFRDTGRTARAGSRQS
jgi:hypothetical protein